MSLRHALEQVDPDGKRHGFHVAMSAGTYQVLCRQYRACEGPSFTGIIWEDLWIRIDHRCAYGVVEHRQGWKP